MSRAKSASPADCACNPMAKRPIARVTPEKHGLRMILHMEQTNPNMKERSVAKGRILRTRSFPPKTRKGDARSGAEPATGPKSSQQCAQQAILFLDSVVNAGFCRWVDSYATSSRRPRLLHPLHPGHRLRAGKSPA